LVNRLDPYHGVAAEWSRDFRGQLLTTDAVVTEVAYVLAATPTHRRAALTWLQRARAANRLSVEQVPDYERLAAIMEQYAELPCDFADATLIDLAERSGVTAVATLDQRGFSVYRLRGGRRFRILVGPS